MTNTKKKYTVVPPSGDPVEVEATSVDVDGSGTSVTFYNGEDVVASFRGYQSFAPSTSG